MSDIMRPIPFEQLLRWVVEEYTERGSIFGISQVVRKDTEDALPIFDEKIESPFGPAAGPNTQLAQNIIAAYAAGARFFELKTVQKMDGRELAECVPKPCIASGDECYNCEWSTELEVGQAYSEYVKAWFICHILAREFDLGSPDGFVFNMSVGYDLEGIKTPKVDGFIEGMKDASASEIWQECMDVSLKAVANGMLKKTDREFIASIPKRISGSITESTLHGCPPDEIERIANYLITEKGLNTFIKCNPTLLGYEFARKTLDELGFDYIQFDDHHFLEDLQWSDAVPMFERLQKICDERGLEFGLKLTNTFPVDVKAGELPSEEMYMSGRSLFPLTIELVRRISEQFEGRLRISYSGGADYFNIRKIFDAGIWPITMATTLLKPGGYQRMSQISELFENTAAGRFAGVDIEKVRALAEYSKDSSRYKKPVKGIPKRKMPDLLPLMDCFNAPCRTNCPIEQDIPAYLRAMEEGRPEDALLIILERNALPFTTGTICPHTCGQRCMRGHYEESIHIREMKLLAAQTAYASVLPNLKPAAQSEKRVAVIGAGPAGLAAASFLSRAGASVTVFEKNEKAGGVPRYVIPGFRIADEAIDHDIELCRAYGAEIITGKEIASIEELKRDGFTDIVIAIGAWKAGRRSLEEGEEIDALEFLRTLKASPEKTKPGKTVAVIGGGNTAMDAARAAKRLPGVDQVTLVYRRTRRYMPADEEELELALGDGVEFRELLSPVRHEGGKLVCSVMRLGEPDESGRRSPMDTGEVMEIAADTVISAVGERVEASLYESAGIVLNEKGLPVVDASLQTSVCGVYAIGDGKGGPATVVKAIADAQKAAAAIAGAVFDRVQSENHRGDVSCSKEKKGRLAESASGIPDKRCLGCAAVCEVCSDVCPNRANIAIKVPGLKEEQILHLDGMCNECGNCAVFCPYSGRPYADKFTLFWSQEDFADSKNQGFVVTEDRSIVRVRLDGVVKDVMPADENCGLPEAVRRLITAVMRDYSYLLRR